jgi:hypothetical protein
MTIHYPFKVSVLQYTVPNWSYYKPILLGALPPYEKGDDTVSSDYLDKSKSNYLHIFDEFIEPVLQQFRRDVGHAAYIKNVWTQRARKCDHHCVHNHGSNGWAAVLYVDYNPNIHSATTFLSPFTEASSGDHMDYTPDVKEGDIVFFPSQLLHYANPNTHDKERVILSFNMMGINEIDIYQMKLNETN